MKTILAFAAALVCATASFAENYYVATVTDFLGNKTFSAVTKEEGKALELQIKQQNALFTKVLAELQSEIQKNPGQFQTEKKFIGKLKPQTVKLMPQTFPDEIKAREKAEKLQEHEDEADATQATGKKKKKLSPSQQKKAFEEAEKQLALEAFSVDILKKVQERLSAAEGAK